MPNQESRRDLAHSLRDAVESVEQQAIEQAARERRRLEARARRQGPLLGVAVLGWGLLTWLWVTKPAVIFEPDRGPSPTPERVEAGLRFALYLQAARVREFIADSARTPRTLAETGAVEDGVTWEPQEAGWALTGRDGTLTLRLTDRMAVDSFLGNSLGVLRQP